MTIRFNGRYLLWLLFAAISPAGCGGSSSGAEGTWELDNAAMVDAFEKRLEESGARLPPLARQSLAQELTDMDWTVTLHDGGPASLKLNERGQDFDTFGSWRMEGSALTLEYHDRRDRLVVLAGALTGGRIAFQPEHPDGVAIVLRPSHGAALAQEELPSIPDMGPLRADCPASLDTPERAEGPVDDIQQMRPGMPFDDALAILECRDDVRVVQTAPLFSIPENFGVPTRQLIRAADGIPCSAREARGDRCSALAHFEALRDITSEYVVAFTGLPGEEVARAVWRRRVYSEQDGQTVSMLAETLIAKYGAPQLQATGRHTRLNDVRDGATNLVWLFNREGHPVPPPTAQFSSAALGWETCVNGPKPVFAGRHGWNSGCHLTIRAEILPRSDNSLIARELNMVVMHQRDFFYGGQQFQAALRALSDQRLREQGRRPEL